MTLIFGSAFFKIFIRHGLDLGGFHRQVPVLQHMEFLCDGTGCPDIVSGQHFHFDAGTAAVADGVIYVRA